MAKLAQLLAVQKGVKSSTYRDQTDLYRDLGKPQLLAGLSRTYQPKDEEGEQLPPESTKVQASAEEILTGTSRLLTRYWDVTATVDATNCKARGDVTVDGQELLTGVPVPTLLFLEKQLQDILTTMRALPKLDPAEEWTFDPAANCWRAEPSKTIRTKKIPRNHVRAEATEKHPAQVDLYMEDVTVGTWTTTRFSGAMPARRIAELIDGAEKLLRAVKYAREDANNTEVTDVKMGEVLFEYLLAQ